MKRSSLDMSNPRVGLSQ